MSSSNVCSQPVTTDIDKIIDTLFLNDTEQCSRNSNFEPKLEHEIKFNLQLSLNSSKNDDDTKQK
jgi:hypothetical protein